jgi:hypothetical protein
MVIAGGSKLLEESMNRSIKVTLAAGLALGGLGVFAQTASALPMQGLNTAAATAGEVQGSQANIEKTRYICGYWGCRWVPGPYWHRRYWGHPYWHHYGWHRYGWHRGWPRWHRW